MSSSIFNYPLSLIVVTMPNEHCNNIKEEINVADSAENVADEESIVFPSHTLIAAYLNKVKSIEREELKVGLLKLSVELSKYNITVPLDFQPYGDTFYSEIFDRDVMFLSSAGIICEKRGSIIYEITERGENLFEKRDLIYKNVPPIAIEKVDSLLNGLSGKQCIKK